MPGPVPPVRESLDTTTPGARLVFHVFAALAEFIRELIVQGTREGLTAARARGERIGRPPAMTEEQLRRSRLADRSGEHDHVDRQAPGCLADHALQVPASPVKSASAPHVRTVVAVRPVAGPDRRLRHFEP
ncbi:MULTISPECIES: recombinase family protein [unclassified Streptomyces]|uniref:recombinase family protein n=1 Tax=unclassified Streptomyces TaxID=2593676 RepID=UPI0036E931EC